MGTLHNFYDKLANSVTLVIYEPVLPVNAVVGMRTQEVRGQTQYIRSEAKYLNMFAQTGWNVTNSKRFPAIWHETEDVMAFALEKMEELPEQV